MTKRQAILQAIATRLQMIQRANGYASDAGLALYVHQHGDLGQDDPSEAVGLAIGDDTATDQSGHGGSGGLLLIALPVEVMALVKFTTHRASAWAVAEEVIGDIKRAMEGGDLTLGGLLSARARRVRTRTRRLETGSTTLGIGVGYVLTYTEVVGSPEV